MKTINLLLRIRIRGLVGRLTRSTRESQKKKMGAGTIVLLAVLGAFLFLTFSSMFFALFMSLLFSLRAADIDLSFYFAATGALVLLLCLFGSVTATQSELYGSRDNELLLSMPIPPSSYALAGPSELSVCAGGEPSVFCVLFMAGRGNAARGSVVCLFPVLSAAGGACRFLPDRMADLPDFLAHEA